MDELIAKPSPKSRRQYMDVIATGIGVPDALERSSEGSVSAIKGRYALLTDVGAAATHREMEVREFSCLILHSTDFSSVRRK